MVFHRGLLVVLAVAAALGESPAAIAQLAAVPQAAAAAAADQLTGDWGGLRSAASTAGVDVNAAYIGEVFGNLAGGVDRGTIYEDRLSIGLDADLQKLLAWQGATAHVSMYRIDGHGPSANLVGNILDTSGIEALPATRLFTLWLQQNWFNGDFSLRLGQLAMDDEFLVSATSANLINATFGNPALNYANMIAAGPVYPVADPGVRLRLQPRAEVALLAAAFAADPGGGCGRPVQLCDPSGTTFSFGGGTLWLGEIQYSINQGEGAAGLPGTYKIGGWRETGDFADQEFGLDAAAAPVPLTSPSVVRPLEHSGDFALYAVADQMLWRQPGTKDLGLSGFLRLGGAPAADRNPVSLYADGGFGWKGIIPGRGDDTAVIGIAYAEISPDAAGLSRLEAALKPGLPIRDYESVVEVSYLAQIRPWFALQPDLQYIVHPGGNLPNPQHPPAAIGDAVLLGLRATISF